MRNRAVVTPPSLFLLLKKEFFGGNNDGILIVKFMLKEVIARYKGSNKSQIEQLCAAQRPHGDARNGGWVPTPFLPASGPSSAGKNKKG